MSEETSIQGRLSRTILDHLESMELKIWRLLLLERELCGTESNPFTQEFEKSLKEYQRLSLELCGNIRGDRTPQWLESHRELLSRRSIQPE